MQTQYEGRSRREVERCRLEMRVVARRVNRYACGRLRNRRDVISLLPAVKARLRQIKLREGVLFRQGRLIRW